MESSSRSQDKQIAGLRAKAQLGYYLEKNNNQVVMELKHFYMQSQERRNDESIYRFKVDKDNVKVFKSR